MREIKRFILTLCLTEDGKKLHSSAFYDVRMSARYLDRRQLRVVQLFAHNNFELKPDIWIQQASVVRLTQAVHFRSSGVSPVFTFFPYQVQTQHDNAREFPPDSELILQK